MKFNAFRTVIVTAMLTGTATIVMLRWGLLPEYSKPALREFETARAADVKQPQLSPDEQVNIDVYGKVSPGVVNITKTVVEYGFFFTPFSNESTGSGVVLDTSGNVLTNNHVVESAQSLEVALPDHTTYQANIVGTDPQNDLAVIRLVAAPRERLHPVAFGDSATLKVGQKVLAIGNPFRMQNTLTTGIISSLGRKIETDTSIIDNVIQTDAAINPGNSGGPLLNSAGEMIGINTMIISPGGANGGNVGIGFAVPVNTVRRVVADLIKEGRVLRPDMGVDAIALTPTLASALNLPVDRGLMIVRVYRGTTAENAGLQGATEYAVLRNYRIPVGGDIITEIDGKPVASQSEMDLALESRRPGETVRIVYYRGRSRVEKSMVLREQPRRYR
jgi:S1-C subfamily serine protease